MGYAFLRHADAPKRHKRSAVPARATPTASMAEPVPTFDSLDPVYDGGARTTHATPTPLLTLTPLLSLVCSGAAVQGAARRVCGAVWRAAGPVRALAGCVAPLCCAPRARQPRITVAAHPCPPRNTSQPAPTRRSGPRAQGMQHTPICPRSPTSANRRPREPDRRAHRLRGLLRAAHGHRAGAPLPQRLLSPLGLTLLRT